MTINLPLFSVLLSVKSELIFSLRCVDKPFSLASSSFEELSSVLQAVVDHFPSSRVYNTILHIFKSLSVVNCCTLLLKFFSMWCPSRSHVDASVPSLAPVPSHSSGAHACASFTFPHTRPLLVKAPPAPRCRSGRSWVCFQAQSAAERLARIGEDTTRFQSGLPLC